MKLKEIKPGMAIHCKNDEEKKALLEEAERLRYVWIDKSRPTDFQVFESTGMTINFTRYDSADAVESMMIGRSGVQKENTNIKFN